MEEIFADLLDDTSVQWKIDDLGVSQSEGAVLESTVRHTGPCSGTVEVNESIDYSDAEGNVVNFPSPELDVDCDIEVQPEHCPEPVDLTVDGCEDPVEFDAGDLGACQPLGSALFVLSPGRYSSGSAA